MRKFVVAFGASVLLAQAALAASQQDWNACSGPDPAQAVSACGVVILDRDAAPQDRADAYVFRAGALLAQGDLDGAIADYSDAIALTPQNMVAHASRAIAYARKGDNAHAVDDYVEARRLDPDKVGEMAAANPELKQIAAKAPEAPPTATQAPAAKLDTSIKREAPVRQPAPPPPVAAVPPAPPPAENNRRENETSAPSATNEPPRKDSAPPHKTPPRRVRTATTGPRHCVMISQESCYPHCNLAQRQANMRRWNKCMAPTGVTPLPIPTQ